MKFEIEIHQLNFMCELNVTLEDLVTPMKVDVDYLASSLSDIWTF